MPVADEKSFPALVSSSPRSYEYRRWRTPSPPLRPLTPRGVDPEVRSADSPPSRPVSPTLDLVELPTESADLTQEESEYALIDLEDYMFPPRAHSPNGTLVDGETSRPHSPVAFRRLSNTSVPSPLSGRRPRLSISGLAARFTDKENRARSRSRSRTRDELGDDGEMKRSSSDSADRPRITLAAPRPTQPGGFLRHLSFSRPSSPLFPGNGDSSFARERRGSATSVRAPPSAM